MFDEYLREPRINNKKSYNTLLAQNCFNFLLFILGIAFFIAGTISPHENDVFFSYEFMSSTRVYGMILMIYGAVMIAAFYSRNKVGWIIQVMAGMLFVLLACLSLMYIPTLVIPFLFYGIHTLWAVLTPNGSDYFKTKGFPDKESKIISTCVISIVIIAAIIHFMVI